MVSTPTTRLRLERQGLGENLNVWGETKLNDALERIDEAVAGVQSIAISGTSTTLTSVNYATDQSRKAALVLTGTLSANSTITVPGVEKLYLVVNNTTQGAYSLTIKTAAGTGYALRPGPQHVYCNGTDVFRATPRLDQVPAPTAAVDMGSQKLTGLGAPTLGTDATTKTYVDAADAGVTTAVAASASSASSSATAAAGSASSASTSASNAATSATAAASSASAASTSATNAASSATAAQTAAASISGGPVTSVNGETGIVSLDADDIAATAARIWYTTAQQTKLSGIAAGATANSSDATLLARANHTGSQAISTVTDLQTTLDAKATLASVNTFTKAVRGSIVALTDAATIAVDASLGNYFSVTLGGNRTLGNPTNLVAGQGGSIIITQDATGSRTLAYASNWKFAGGTAPVLTTTAAAVDRLDYLVVSGSLIHASLTKDIK